jgi:16S rRNA (cytidine1402-2'-O)-methyltransferase
MTLLIGKSERAAVPAGGKDIASRVEEIMREGSVDENTALKVVAKELGVSKSEAYRELQRVRRKK